MRGRGVAGFYSCNVPANGKNWTNEPSVSKVDTEFGGSIISASRVHARSFASASSSFFMAYSCVSLP